MDLAGKTWFGTNASFYGNLICFEILFIDYPQEIIDAYVFYKLQDQLIYKKVMLSILKKVPIANGKNCTEIGLFDCQSRIVNEALYTAVYCICLHCFGSI